MRRYIFIALALAATLAVNARVRTTHKQLKTDGVAMERIDTVPGDSAVTVDPDAVTLRGYSKRASDSKESFLVTNNLDHRISAIRLLLRYTTLTGEMIHQRTITIPVSLNPGDTQMTSVKTFDQHHSFYYYAGPKPRKTATPFKVAVRLLGYDVPVGM